MGAWGHEPFANDIALDWSNQLQAVDDLSIVEDALLAVVQNDDDYLEADLACDALAACEVIARLKGNWGRKDRYSQAVDQWVERYPQKVPSRILRRALKAIDRIIDDDSELRELWYEGQAGDDWMLSVTDLRSRVER
jgi:hypothetical protein